jgi:hypothetical protein
MGYMVRGLVPFGYPFGVSISGSERKHDTMVENSPSAHDP